MSMRDQARELAESGRYEDSSAVIFALFKLGYARAPTAFNLLDRIRLNHLCRKSMRRSQTSRR